MSTSPFRAFPRCVSGFRRAWGPRDCGKGEKRERRRRGGKGDVWPTE